MTSPLPRWADLMLIPALNLLLAFLVVAGAANALAHPAANLLLARNLPIHRQGLGFAIKQAAIPLATLLSGFAVPSIVLSVGWRWAFVASAALALASIATVPRAAGPGALPRDAGTRGGRSGDLPLGVMGWLAAGVALGAASAGTLGAFFVSAGVDAVTTSQAEADQKRGREIRQREERLGKLQRTYEKQLKECHDGKRAACSNAQRTYAEIQLLMPSVPAEPEDPRRR